MSERRAEKVWVADDDFEDKEDAEAFRGICESTYRRLVLQLKTGFGDVDGYGDGDDDDDDDDDHDDNDDDDKCFDFDFISELSNAGKIRVGRFLAGARGLCEVDLTLTEEQPQSVGLVFQGPFEQDHSLRSFGVSGYNYARGNARMALEDWSNISRYLGKACSLEHLQLCDLSIDKGELEHLASGLGGSKLKTLSFTRLDLRGDDASLGSFLCSLNPSRLTKITLRSCNSGIGVCEGLASILRIDESTINYLQLDGNPFDDECARVLCASLMKYASLEDIYIGNTAITGAGWRFFAKLVLDPTNLESIYKSNHTIQHIWGHPRENGLLRINKYELCKVRKKIVRTLTNDCTADLNIGLLNDREVHLIPHILELFGDQLVRHQLLYIYQIIRWWNIPELFGFPSAEKLRLSAQTNKLEKQNHQLRKEMEQMREEHLVLKSEIDRLKSENQLYHGRYQNDLKRARLS